MFLAKNWSVFTTYVRSSRCDPVADPGSDCAIHAAIGQCGAEAELARAQNQIKMSAARSTHAPCWSVADPGTEPVTVQYAAIA
jgi:hypothetical protein